MTTGRDRRRGLPTDPDGGGVQPPQRQRRRLLTLTTCSAMFHPDHRMIACATLAEIRPVP